MTRRTCRAACGLTAFFLAVGPAVTANVEPPRVTPLPRALTEWLNPSPFYKKHVSAGGLAVLGSEKVSDHALLEAADIINHLLCGREEIRCALLANKVRCVVMAHDEFTTMVPEHSDLKPARYWDKRARGLGATPRRPAVSCGEENLLAYPGDPYAKENILIHEFAHAVHEMALNEVDPTFDGRLKKAYDAAKGAGLWQGSYAATSRNEYWAEGVQSWFDCNRENDRAHNHVNTRAELKEYDPALARLVAEVFGDGPWRYRKPAARPQAARAHLQGYDAARAPRFAWPEDLLAWNQTYVANTERGEADLVALSWRKPGAAERGASLPSNRESSILFLNRRPHAASLFWLDGNGERRPYGIISPGERRRQSTYAGHVWLVTGPGGQPFGSVVADDEPGKAVIE